MKREKREQRQWIRQVKDVRLRRTPKRRTGRLQRIREMSLRKRKVALAIMLATSRPRGTAHGLCCRGTYTNPKIDDDTCKIKNRYKGRFKPSGIEPVPREKIALAQLGIDASVLQDKGLGLIHTAALWRYMK